MLAGGAAYIVSRHTPPTYRAAATLLVNATAQPNALTYNDVLLNQSLTQTYSKIATETPVLAEVIRLGHLHTSVSTLQGEVQASPVPQTQLITVSASAGSAEEAAKIANLTAQVFIEQQNQRVLHDQDSNALSIVEPAAPPPTPAAPRILLNTVLGTGLGFLGSLGVVALITYFDDTLKSESEIESKIELPVLGVVRRDPSEATVILRDGALHRDNRFTEIFRIVRANVEFTAVPTRARVLLVTSTDKSEGKITVATRLAIAFAEAGKQTVLVDADLRLPRIHDEFELDNRFGLTSLLVSAATRSSGLDAQLHSTPQQHLWVLTSGPIPPNPTELLHSDAMERLVAELRERFDIVVIDTPPVLAVADAMTLAPKIDGVVFVIESGKVRFATIQEALTRLRRSNTPVLGVVLNKVSRDTSSYYYYSYDGYYSKASVDGARRSRSTRSTR